MSSSKFAKAEEASSSHRDAMLHGAALPYHHPLGTRARCTWSSSWLAVSATSIALLCIGSSPVLLLLIADLVQPD